MKRGPLVGFGLLCVVVSLLAALLDHQAWALGAGDAVLVGSAVVVLALVGWDRRLTARDRDARTKRGAG